MNRLKINLHVPVPRTYDLTLLFRKNPKDVPFSGILGRDALPSHLFLRLPVVGGSNIQVVSLNMCCNH